MLMESMSSIRLVEDSLIFIIDIEVQDVVVHNIIYEPTFVFWITSLLNFVDDRLRRFLLLYHPGGADLLLLLDGPLLDCVIQEVRHASSLGGYPRHSSKGPMFIGLPVDSSLSRRPRG